MAEHLPYYGHEQGCYNSRIPWGPEPCSGCVSLRRAFSQGQRDEREACALVVEENAAAHAEVELPTYAEVLRAVASQIRAREEKPNG